MAFETALQRLLYLPQFIQQGGDEPRGVHWVGGNKETKQTPPSHNQNNRSNSRDPHGYRDLADIHLEEVDEAYNFFIGQLRASPHENWIAKNYFCLLPIEQKNEHRPPVIFGRVKNCYPMDGYVQNIQHMEIYFPQNDRPPDKVTLRADDIPIDPYDRRAHSYCVGIRFLASEKDRADFSESQNLFIESGFISEFDLHHDHLLNLHKLDNAKQSWIYVIGSRWYAELSKKIQPEIKRILHNLILNQRILINYHPESLPRSIKTLNKELGFKAGFTETYLIEPEDPKQTIQILNSSFDKLFQLPMKRKAQ